MRAVHAFWFACASTAISAGALACGARGPLDEGALVVVAAMDASVADVVVVDAATVIVPPGPLLEMEAGADGGIVECSSCLVDQCASSIVACAEDTACRSIFQCAVTTCVANGGLDTKCLLGCASGDLGGISQIFKIFQCVTQTCGNECNPLLGGLHGSRRPADAGPARAPIERAFSPWPGLASHE